MKKIHYLDSIISPNITEKSTSMSEFDKVVFKVNKKANKIGLHEYNYNFLALNFKAGKIT